MKGDISKTTIRQFQIFVSVMEHRSFAKAAEELGLTPPAVSMQMKTLADLLGVQLFNKVGRAIEPTGVAKSFLPHAVQIVESLEEAHQALQSTQSELSRRVRVAMVTTSRNFGPALINEFQQLHPAAKIELTIENRAGVVDALRDRRVDVALMGRTPRRVEVETKVFAPHPYVLIANPKHPLTRFKRIRRADLSAHRFIAREKGSGTRMVHDHFFEGAGLPMPRVQEMDSNANIKNAVMAQLGLAFISAHTIGLEREVGRLVVLDVQGMPELREWMVVWPKGSLLQGAADDFRTFVLERAPQVMIDMFGNDFGAR